MNGKYWKILLAGLFTATLTFANSVSACDSLGSANLVTNCGFETGDFTGWTLAGNTDPTETFVASTPGANSGNYYAALGAVGSDNILSQEIATDAGRWYTFSFDLWSDGSSPNDFTALWGGNVLFNQSPVAAGDTVESFQVAATSSTTEIEFDSRNDAGWLRLDDVAVVAAEPSSAFLGVALLGLPLLGLRRLRKVTEC